MAYYPSFVVVVDFVDFVVAATVVVVEVVAIVATAVDVVVVAGVAAAVDFAAAYSTSNLAQSRCRSDVYQSSCEIVAATSYCRAEFEIVDRAPSNYCSST